MTRALHPRHFTRFTYLQNAATESLDALLPIVEEQFTSRFLLRGGGLARNVVDAEQVQTGCLAREFFSRAGIAEALAHRRIVRRNGVQMRYKLQTPRIVRKRHLHDWNFGIHGETGVDIKRVLRNQ